MYSSYTAASFARKHALADRHGVNLEGALTWAFEFEDQPYFAGQRVLASNGIDLPVLNVFRMFSKMSGLRLQTSSSGEVPLDEIMRAGVRGAPDVGALASMDGDKVWVMLWHYHDDDISGPDAKVELAIEGLPPKPGLPRVTEHRIDSRHSNAYAEWQRMGAPTEPNEKQYGALVRAGALAEAAAPSVVPGPQGRLGLSVVLARQAVTLVTLEW